MNVVLPNGSNAHISFIEKTGKGSVYYTNDPELVMALKSHPRYGKLYKEVAEPVVAVAPVKKEEGAAAASESAKGVVKEFSNNEDAKDFLAERYEVSRSKMRTRSAIESTAKSLGVTIVWKA